MIAYVQFQNDTWPDDSGYAAVAAADDVRCSYCASGLITGYALNVNDGKERSQEDRTTITRWMDHLKTKVIKAKRPQRNTRGLWRTMYCDWLQLNNAISKWNGLEYAIHSCASNLSRVINEIDGIEVRLFYGHTVPTLKPHRILITRRAIWRR